MGLHFLSFLSQNHVKSVNFVPKLIGFGCKVLKSAVNLYDKTNGYFINLNLSHSVTPLNDDCIENHITNQKAVSYLPYHHVSCHSHTPHSEAADHKQ